MMTEPACRDNATLTVSRFRNQSAKDQISWIFLHELDFLESELEATVGRHD